MTETRNAAADGFLDSDDDPLQVALLEACGVAG